MQPQKTLLYYIFRPLRSTGGQSWAAKGGIEHLLSYINQNTEYPPCKEIEYKWSEDNRDDLPRLKVKARNEVVGFSIPNE